MDSSLPGSSVHGIFQASVLEWAAISFSRGSSQPRDRTQVSCIADTLPSEPPGKPSLIKGNCKPESSWRSKLNRRLLLYILSSSSSSPYHHQIRIMTHVQPQQYQIWSLGVTFHPKLGDQNKPVISFGTLGRKRIAAAAKSLQSCPTLCDPIDGSPPGSPVPGKEDWGHTKKDRWIHNS